MQRVKVNRNPLISFFYTRTILSKVKFLSPLVKTQKNVIIFPNLYKKKLSDDLLLCDLDVHDVHIPSKIRGTLSDFQINKFDCSLKKIKNKWHKA